MARRVKTTLQLDSGLLIQNGAGAGKVLTSDASGNATWAALGASAPSGGGRLYSGVGPPQAVAGVAGDYWLDTAAGILYGPKGSNADSPLNLHTNPSVETNINGYTITASVPAGAGLSERTQAWAVHGSWSHHSVIVRDAVTNCSINTNGAGTSGIVVKPSTAYSVQLHHRLRNTPAFTAGGVTLRIAWYKSDGSASTILAQTGALDYVNGVAGDVLVLRGLNSISPADAAFARLLMYSPQNPGTWDADTDAVIFVEGATLPTEWPATGVKLTASGPAGGDLSGSYPNPVVEQSSSGNFNVLNQLNIGEGPQSIYEWPPGGPGLETTTQLNFERTSETQKAITSEVDTDTYNRHRVLIDGKHEWGQGDFDLDTNLYRSMGGTLRTDGSFEAEETIRAGVITSLGQIAANDAIMAHVTLGNIAFALFGPTGSARFAITPHGTMSALLEWGDGTNPADVNLYRGAANKLQTDDTFVINGTSWFDKISDLASDYAFATRLGSTETPARFTINTDGRHEWGPGGGASRDTVLYRDPAGNKLKTDDAFDIAGILRVTSSLIQIPPPLVSVLPSNAVNGQEVYFQDSQLAAQNIVWHMRFRGPAPNRWEFVGGGEWATADYPNRTGFSTASISTFTDMGLTGTNPTPFTAPFSGVYQFGGLITVSTTATAQFRANIGVGGAVGSSNYVNVGGSPGTWTIPFWGQSAVNAGQACTLFGATNNLAVNLAPLRTRLTVQPIYASAMP